MISSLYLRLAGVAVIVLAIGSAVAYVGHLRGQVTSLKEQVTALEVRAAVLSATINGLRSESIRKEEAMKQALNAARVREETAKAKAKVIYKTLPSDPSNTCKSALELVNEQAR